MVSTTTFDPKHVDPYRFATPDGERDASGKYSVRRLVLYKNEGEKRLCQRALGAWAKQQNRALYDGPTDSICHAIGLWRVWRLHLVI